MKEMERRSPSWQGVRQDPVRKGKTEISKIKENTDMSLERDRETLT